MNSGPPSFVFAVISLALPQAEIQSTQNPSRIGCRCFAANWKSAVSITLASWSKHCPQMRAVLLHEFKAGRPIVVIVRRIQVHPSGPFGLTYTLGDARALYYEADRDE